MSMRNAPFFFCSLLLVCVFFVELPHPVGLWEQIVEPLVTLHHIQMLRIRHSCINCNVNGSASKLYHIVVVLKQAFHSTICRSAGICSHEMSKYHAFVGSLSRFSAETCKCVGMFVECCWRCFRVTLQHILLLLPLLLPLETKQHGIVVRLPVAARRYSQPMASKIWLCGYVRRYCSMLVSANGSSMV